MESNGDPGPDLGEWYKPACCTGSTNSGGGLFSSGIATGGPSFDFNHTPGGKYSAALKISTPSTPTSGARLFRWAEPQAYPELYYSVWYYFPERYNPSLFWNVMQWKSQHVGVVTSDPFFSLEVGSLANGEMYFYLGNDQTNTSYSQNAQTFVSIPVRRWVHVEAFYKCDGSGAGEVAMSQDSAQLWDVRNVNTRYADGNCEWSVNNYSTGLNRNTATIYVDDAAICLGGRCPGPERDH